MLPFIKEIKYNTGMKIIIALTIILIILVIAIALVYLEYRRTFYIRMCEPTGFLDNYLAEHPELDHTDFSCTSSRGSLIHGVLFTPKSAPKALIVMTHGYNMSCENYLPLGRIFCEAGFMVLMFDGIGVGMSEGQSIYGLPQHIFDMKSVLDTVGADPELGKLPLLLFGHSWGGYAACTVPCLKDYPIRGILACAPFRKSSSSMTPSIKRRYPAVASMLIASVEFLERLIFGPIASVTSSDGLKKIDCPVKLYHSRDDSVISFKESFETMKEELSGCDNITFIEMDGRNHDLYLRPENDRRQRLILKEMKRSGDTDALRSELWQLMSETDEELAAEFVDFFNSCPI